MVDCPLISFKCDQLLELLRLLNYLKKIISNRIVENIKLYEEYNELNFKGFNIIDDISYNHLDNSLDLNEFEYSKIHNIIPIESNLFFKNGLIQRKYSSDTIGNFGCYINLLKLKDDYYLVEYHINHYVKYRILCDQLPELLRLLKFIKKNEN